MQIYFLPFFITQLWLPKIHALPIGSPPLNVTHIHHIPEGLADTANTQHLDSSTSPSTVNYGMISAIFEGLAFFLALFLALPTLKLYWDKLRSTNTSSNLEHELEHELELGSSNSQIA